MKLSRLSAPVIAFIALALLAACGGGGGGSSVNPPGGGGGGTPPPTSSPTASPTAPPTATPTPLTIAATGTAVYATDGNGYRNGVDGWFNSGATVTGDTTDGDTNSGAISASQNVDGSKCGLMGEPNGQFYHAHSFVGILANGKEYAVPEAIGMINPIDPGSGSAIFSVNTGGCFFQIHTHSESGLIHVEDPTQLPGASTSSLPQYNLQTLLDEWGVSLSGIASGIGSSGTPLVFVGTASGSGNAIANSYTSTSNMPNQILLGHGTVIWLVYGGTPSSLPPVQFNLQI